MLQAMNVGHDGSLTTVHANSPEDVVPRLESLVMMGDVAMSPEAIRRMIGSSINIIVHLVRFCADPGDSSEVIVHLARFCVVGCSVMLLRPRLLTFAVSVEEPQARPSACVPA